MTELQLAACRICLALMLGLLVVSGYVVAPQLFAHSSSRMVAGALAGHVFQLANSALLLLALACATFWMRLRSSAVVIGRLRWSLLGAVALLVAINQWGVSPQMEALKELMPQGYDALSATDPLRHRFATLHGISAVIHLIASLLTVTLVGIGSTESTGRVE
ncbi:MAG: DUF4149 domain-containing protein [Mariprofundales bacterium]|nr:DUF4149 domain-containing protein [Mariprofundales bacterium]